MKTKGFAYLIPDLSKSAEEIEVDIGCARYSDTEYMDKLCSDVTSYLDKLSKDEDEN